MNRLIIEGKGKSIDLMCKRNSLKQKKIKEKKLIFAGGPQRSTKMWEGEEKHGAKAIQRKL